MRVTIIRETNTVAVDGMAFEIGAVSLLPAELHSVQWYDTRGEIEWSYKVCDHCGVGSKRPNEAISQLKVGDTPLQPILDAWTAAKAAADAEAERIRAEQEAAAAEATKVAEQPEPQA